MTDPRMQAAAALMGKMLGGMAIAGHDEVSADFQFDEAGARVWAEVEVESGDVYEISARWVQEKSP